MNSALYSNFFENMFDKGESILDNYYILTLRCSNVAKVEQGIARKLMSGQF